jgi:hypothetical protein
MNFTISAEKGGAPHLRLKFFHKISFKLEIMSSNSGHSAVGKCAKAMLAGQHTTPSVSAWGVMLLGKVLLKWL